MLTGIKSKTNTAEESTNTKETDAGQLFTDRNFHNSFVHSTHPYKSVQIPLSRIDGLNQIILTFAHLSVWNQSETLYALSMPSHTGEKKKKSHMISLFTSIFSPKKDMYCETELHILNCFLKTEMFKWLAN